MANILTAAVLMFCLVLATAEGLEGIRDAIRDKQVICKAQP